MKKTRVDIISLAPIHEYTTAPFRILCERYGCKTTYVPLVNVTSVTKGKFFPEIDETENTNVQLSGSNPCEFASAIKTIENRYPFVKGFNINAGCPSYDTVKTGAGSALMRDQKRLAEIIKKCKGSTSLPVSVKTRMFGDVAKSISFYRAIEEAGADFLIIHGRTAKQGYGGNADWNTIRAASQELAIPVIGNGDIKEIGEANGKIDGGYCEGVMIGRAALQNPMLFKGANRTSDKEKIRLMLEYYEICRETGILDIGNVKLIYSQFTKGMENAAATRSEIMKCKNIDDLLKLIEKLDA